MIGWSYSGPLTDDACHKESNPFKRLSLKGHFIHLGMIFVAVVIPSRSRRNKKYTSWLIHFALVWLPLTCGELEHCPPWTIPVYTSTQKPGRTGSIQGKVCRLVRIFKSTREVLLILWKCEPFWYGSRTPGGNCTGFCIRDKESVKQKAMNLMTKKLLWEEMNAILQRFVTLCTEFERSRDAFLSSCLSVSVSSHPFAFCPVKMKDLALKEERLFSVGTGAQVAVVGWVSERCVHPWGLLWLSAHPSFYIWGDHFDFVQRSSQYRTLWAEKVSADILFYSMASAPHHTTQINPCAEGPLSQLHPRPSHLRGGDRDIHRRICRCWDEISISKASPCPFHSLWSLWVVTSTFSRTKKQRWTVLWVVSVLEMEATVPPRFSSHCSSALAGQPLSANNFPYA